MILGTREMNERSSVGKSFCVDVLTADTGPVLPDARLSRIVDFLKMREVQSLSRMLPHGFY